ncbi:MAG: NADAR family protein [Clostridia bacterium]|nr:NADAR family protein [Clostridia bacterium]
MLIFHDADKEYGFLSNWYRSEFYSKSKRFSSVEQYLMYHKALIFGDTDTAAMILKEDDPAVIQKLGRKVTPYIDTIWAGRCQAVLYRGLMCKFSQNPTLRSELLMTGDAILVEGTASDKRFANGLTRTDPDRYDMQKWLGKNLLGFTLMEVRDELSSKEC